MLGRALAFGLLASLSFACAALPGAEEDAEATEHAKRIEPKDDENLGYVEVIAPAGVSVDVTTATAASYLSADRQTNVTLPIAEATRVRAGEGTVSVNGGFVGGGAQVTIAQGKTTSVKLAGADVTYDKTPLDVDFGRRATYLVTGNGDGARSGIVQAPGTFLLLGGTYELSFGTDQQSGVRTIAALSMKPVTFPEGRVTKVDLTPPDVRATIVIKQPTRDFPDAVPSARNASYPNCHRAPLVIVQRADATTTDWSRGTLHAFKTLPIDADQKLRVFPFVASEAPAHYEVVVNNLPVTVDAQVGKTSTVSLERLDVDDVEITTETGAKKKVPGTWQLFVQSGASWRQVEISDKKAGCDNIASLQFASFPTQRGVDVPAGTYKVVVTYSTDEQANKTKEYVVSVP